MEEKLILLNDKKCKERLSIKKVLAIIINTFIPEFEDLDYESIERCIVGYSKDSDKIKSINKKDDYLKDSTVVYDLLYKVKYPNSEENFDLIINIEPQANTTNINYPLTNRAIYYASRLLTIQKNKPKNNDVNKVGYKDLKKVYSIWLCQGKNANDDCSISLYDTNETKLFGNYKNKDDYKLINVIIVTLGKDIDTIIDDETNEFSYFLGLMRLMLIIGGMTDEQRAQRLATDYDIIVPKEDMSSMHWTQDMLDSEYGYGYRQGVEQGIQQGQLNTRLSDVKNIMSSFGVDFEKASETLKLNKAEKDIILKELNGARKN